MLMPYLILIVSLCSGIFGEGAIKAMTIPEETDSHSYAPPVGDSLDALINGRLYQFQSVRNGQPYFNDQNWVESSISTRYETFTNVLVKYDIFQDMLITPLYLKEGTYAVVLNPQYIRSFTLGTHTFVNLNSTIPSCNVSYSGYYEVLYDGDLKMLVKWQKVITDEDKISGADFELVKTLYLFSDNHLYRLKRNRSLIKLFPEHKKAIRNYIRDNQVYLNRSGNDALIKLTEFIDHLTD